MDVLLEILLLVLLLLIFYQDAKWRAIHVMLPLVICIIGLYYFIHDRHDPWILLHNVLFLAITILGLYLYLSVKHRKLVNPFEFMGIGDLFFFLAVIPFFSTPNYILFFISGMVFSLVSFLIIKVVSKTDLVPLAGLLAMYMIMLKGIFYIIDLDMLTNNLI